MHSNSHAGEVSGVFKAACVADCKNPLRSHCPFSVDITQVQRLQSLGLLVGEVVHDLSNLLSLALGHTEIAIEKLAAEETVAVREHLLHSQQALKNCGGLCRDLLVYAGKSSAVRTLYDPYPHLKELGALLDVSIARQAMFEVEIASGLPSLEGDPNHLRQIVMNLVLNASESLQGKAGGKVSLCVSVDHRHESESDAAVDSDSTWLKICVRDNGCGMDAATLQRIGTPFFTTKLTGRGLGLTAVRQLLDVMSGRLSVESRLGEGTCFSVYVPCAQAGSRCVGDAPVAVEDDGGNLEICGTVLLVDDEPGLLAVQSAILERIGLRVVRACDGEEALRQFEAESDTIGLVFLDMMMSNMGGGDTLGRLRSIRADIPVVLISGCSEVWIREHLGGAMPEAVLTKPVSASCLRKAARKWYRSPDAGRD